MLYDYSIQRNATSTSVYISVLQRGEPGAGAEAETRGHGRHGEGRVRRLDLRPQVYSI